MSTIYTFKNKFVSDILQSDSKLSNLDSGYDYVNEVSFYVIETIPEFLVRIAFEFRAPGSVVTMLVPKEGLTPPMKYFSMGEVDAAMANFDIKYYTFKGGMQDINFVEIIGPDIYEEKKNKGASNGYVGMTLFDINFKNVANTFTSLLRNINTAVRTYVFPDKSGTVALTSDLHPPVSIHPDSASKASIGASQELIINLPEPDPSSEDIGLIGYEINHGFSVGEAVKLEGSTWVRTMADSGENAGTIGIVSEILSLDSFKYIVQGLLPGNYTEGAIYFLSTAVPGGLMIASADYPWQIGQIYEYIGTGVEDGLLVSIDVGHEISEGLQIYPYLAYATDAIGSNFTKVNNPEYEFAAVLFSSDKFLITIQADFDGLWFRRAGLVGSESHPALTVHADSTAYGSVNPTTQVLTIYAQSGTGGSIAYKSGILSNLLSRNVAVVFTPQFDHLPVGRKNVNVYRVNNNGGKPVDDMVLFYGLNVASTGFSLTIDESEDLTGILIEYLFI